MSEIRITSGSPLAGTRTRRKSSTGQTRLNTVLMGALLLLLVLAPLPFASVRLVFTGMWAAYLGVVGLIYLVLLLQRGEGMRVAPGKLGVPLLLMSITCLYLVVQMLPLFSFTLATADGAEIAASTISIAPSSTLLALTRQLSYGLLFILVAQVSVNDARRALALNVLLLVIIACGVYALISLQSGDTILGLPKWAYLGSATGTFVNRNSFATFLGFGAIIALSQAAAQLLRQAERHKDDGRIRHISSNVLLYLLGYAILLSVIIATQSRMGLASTLAGSLVVVLLMLGSTRRYGLLIWLAPVGLLVVGGGLALFGSGLLDRVGAVDVSADIRARLYEQVTQLIAMRPWTGFGGGAFELAFPLVHQPPVSPDFAWTRAHSTYLTLWSELGLIAGTLPMLAVALLAARLLAAIRQKRGSWTAQTIALGVISVGAVHSLVDFSLEIPANALMFVALVAMGVGTATMTSSSSKS